MLLILCASPDLLPSFPVSRKRISLLNVFKTRQAQYMIGIGPETAFATVIGAVAISPMPRASNVDSRNFVLTN